MTQAEQKVLADVIMLLENTLGTYKLVAQSVPNSIYAEGLIDGLEGAIIQVRAIRNLPSAAAQPKEQASE